MFAVNKQLRQRESEQNCLDLRYYRLQFTSEHFPSRFIPIYRNSSLVFLGLSVISISYNNTVFTKPIAESWEHTDLVTGSQLDPNAHTPDPQSVYDTV